MGHSVGKVKGCETRGVDLNRVRQGPRCSQCYRYIRNPVEYGNTRIKQGKGIEDRRDKVIGDCDSGRGGDNGGCGWWCATN